MHAVMQQIRPTFRYAGCEPRDAPYLSENCSAFGESNVKWLRFFLSGQSPNGFQSVFQSSFVMNLDGLVVKCYGDTVIHVSTMTHTYLIDSVKTLFASEIEYLIFPCLIPVPFLKIASCS